MTTASIEPTHPLQIRDFRLFFAARFSAIVATMGMVVVLGWQTYDLARGPYGYSIHQSAFLLGLLGLAQFIPLFILTPFAGWVADRFERGRVAMCSMGIDLTLALTLGITTALQLQTLPLLFGLAAFHGIARVFLGPALSAIVPNIVPPALLPRAIALSSIAWQSAAIGGPALGGVLYAYNASLPYTVAVACLGIAILCLAPIRRVVPPPMDRSVHPIQQMIDGLRYVRGHRFLLGAITLDLFAVLLGGANALLPVFARDVLHVGPEGLGQLRAAPALGAATIALWFAFRPLKTNVGVKMLVAVFGFGIATMCLGLSAFAGPAPVHIPGLGDIVTKSMLLALISLIFVGGLDMFSVYIRSSLVQLHTPDDMRGRVSAVSGLAISASNELGEVQAGTIASILGPVGAAIFGGIGAASVAVLWAWWFPELRRAKSFDPPEAMGQSQVKLK